MNITSIAEGWYRDPFGVHEARWMSMGAPTALVKDAGVEGSDPQPAVRPPGPLLPVEPERGVDHGSDLRRADAAGRHTGFDASAAQETASMVTARPMPHL